MNPMHCAVIALVVFSSVSAGDPADTGFVGHRLDESRVCGPNAAYAFLALLGYPADYDAIRDVHARRPDGLSLLELERLIESHGPPVSARAVAFEEFDRIETPYIMYGQSHENALKHYYIVLDTDRRGILVMNPTTGFTTVKPPDGLARIWGGYVLTAGARPGASNGSAIAGVAAAGGGIAAGVLLAVVGRRARWRPAAGLEGPGKRSAGLERSARLSRGEGG